MERGTLQTIPVYKEMATIGKDKPTRKKCKDKKCKGVGILKSRNAVTFGMGPILLGPSLK